MLCGHKSNQTPTKLSPSKAKLDASPTKHDDELCKGYESPQKPGCLGSIVDNVSPSRVDIVKEDKPVYNKENLLRRFNEVETREDCSPLQDSGYSSILHNDSQYQDEDFSTIAPSTPLFETPKQQTSQNDKPTAGLCPSTLPVLRFEEVVCSTLKKSSKRSPKVDWEIVEEVVSRGTFGLDKLIGKKMGLKKLDILGELFLRDFKHLLSKILRHLSAIDLISVISVSTTWRKILQKDSCAFSVFKQFRKEICEKEARKSEYSATRDSSLFRLPLASVQKVASAVYCVNKKNSNKKKVSASHSRLSEFNEVGKTLVNDQSLKVCRDCRSPAKYDSSQHRAICTRESCQLDFCTLCNCEFHFSKDCVTSKSRSHRYLSDTLPGSKKSKQNLRRL